MEEKPTWKKDTTKNKMNKSLAAFLIGIAFICGTIFSNNVKKDVPPISQSQTNKEWCAENLNLVNMQKNVELPKTIDIMWLKSQIDPIQKNNTIEHQEKKQDVGKQIILENKKRFNERKQTLSKKFKETVRVITLPEINIVAEINSANALEMPLRVKIPTLSVPPIQMEMPMIIDRKNT